MNIFKRKSTKIALALSILAVIMWSILGTGTSLAWFTDTEPTTKNMFQIGELNLVVSHLTDEGYVEIEQDTNVFNDEALYEPGYVQVVYLKVENKGKIPFDYKTAVNIVDHTPAENVFGSTFYLYEHLKFGFITGDTEAEVRAQVENRDLANALSNEDMPINTYSTNTDTLEVGETTFAAIIVRMPKEVGNVANYRGNDIPMVKLGLVVKATQKGTPIE